MENIKFKDLNLGDSVLRAIAKLGYETPSKIQVEIIPEILNGNDVIGQAQTGTGKTLAFAASILTLINKNKQGVKAIVLTPTRELALQVCEEFKTLSDDSGIHMLPVFGGSSIENQIKSLRRGVDIVVGTPGRVMDLMRRGVLKIDALDFFVLDEADEMLNMGFLEDIEFIFEKTNAAKQVLLFSATMPKTIKKLAEKYMKLDYQHIVIEETTKTAVNVKQYYYVINEKHRTELLCRIIDHRNPSSAIIFCQTKKEVDELLNEMTKRNYSVDAIHGDITQNMRIQRLDRFKQGAYKYLIATDVAARGIHIDNISCVINYNLPQDSEGYIHRIGRTGRASNEGYAITLVNHREIRFLSDIERFAKCKIQASELPNVEEILNVKQEKIIANIKEVLENKENEPYIKFVRDLNKEDLIRYGSALFKLVFDKEIGSNLNKDITAAVEKKQFSKNTTRVFMTVGRMDNMSRSDLATFITRETKIDSKFINNVEVLTKFTFVSVDNSVLDQFMEKMNNKKFNGRTIKLEIAKEK